MSEEKKTTIGEVAGLVPLSQLEEARSALEREMKTNERLRQDIETHDQTIVNLEAEHVALDKKCKRAVEDKAYAEREAVKAKGDEARYKREITRLNEANAALTQEVDQLRAKGSEMWETLTETKRVRDGYMKRCDDLQAMYDEAQTELNAWVDMFGPVVEDLTKTFTKTIEDFFVNFADVMNRPEVITAIAELIRDHEKTDEGQGTEQPA